MTCAYQFSGKNSSTSKLQAKKTLERLLYRYTCDTNTYLCMQLKHETCYFYSYEVGNTQRAGNIVLSSNIFFM